MRIGIVNDMALAREALRRVVVAAPVNQVAWLANDGAEAVAATRRDRPDLILMDLIMPGVDGAEATRRIMAETPCPILVVTSSVSGNLGKVYEAMGAGALDAVDTPTLGPDGAVAGAQALAAKIGTIEKLLGLSPSRSSGEFKTIPPPHAGPRTVLVAIGVSTGGPNAVAQILGDLPDDWNASVVVVQHIDASFAHGLSRWLGERSGRRVELVTVGARPERGRVFVAATNDHLVLDADRRFLYVSEPASQPYRPNVDIFFASLRTHWREPGVAALLTGMGRDGAVGLLALRKAGWATIAQDKATSVVWGMPGAAVELDAASRVLPVSEIGAAIVREVFSRANP
jgi:two-component system, chemotaxis family, response regulator WspF